MNYLIFKQRLFSGWYRDCGVIPHTTDVDINVWDDEYDMGIKRFFLGNKKLWIYQQIGTV